MHFSKGSVGCHQQVLKFKLPLATALGTFDRFWIALYQILSWKYEDSENVKADRVSTVIVNLHQIKRRAFCLGHPVLCISVSIRVVYKERAWLLRQALSLYIERAWFLRSGMVFRVRHGLCTEKGHGLLVIFLFLTVWVPTMITIRQALSVLL